ncbi:APC family permease [Aurantiacibacter rhizosphaerae]|uniref:Arginine/agmatine antiporter n=1 Tax=Aurantiacibacter rhizosphaerae TaxID=2691582 RepID=A0A844XDB8_9SPHN|nr:APC family permease [Aurantiacibacter rhizosphaerae]MWV27682.1 amino acid permease [Aurantiacibacter rhizosphaerae]
MDKTPAALPRTVGFWGTALFPVNGMIGAGIFAMPAILVAAVGNFAPWMMLLGAILIAPLAFVFAMLATRFDTHGGPVLYAHAAFGSFFGFQSGWMRYASAVVAVAANTHVAIAYLAVLFPVLEDPTLRSLAVIGFIAFMTLINLVGMRASVNVLGAMTAVKLLPLVALVIFGLFTRDPSVGFSLPQFGQFESVVLLTFYAYMAFENANFPAGELRNPRRTIPLALLTTIAAVALFYMLVIWAYLAIAPQAGEGESALAAAANVVAGQAGVIVISIAAAFSIGANILNGGIVVPRMTFGMAEQGTLPRIFAHVSSRFQTPDVSVLFYGGAAIVFSLWAGFAALAVASTLSRLVMYLLCSLALPVLQNRDEAKASWWHLPLAIIAAISTLWVASHASAEAFQMLGLIFAVGTGLYFIAARQKAGE